MRLRLYRNIAHLFLWQGSNYLIPLLITPYLARVLGLRAYGVFGFSLAVASYGMLLTDWGFNLSAAQKVARAADDPVELRTIFWGTMTAKSLLALLALVLLAIATLSVPLLRATWPAIFASSLIVLATALSANFFLQGLQYMGAFAASAMIGRLSIIPLMLLFVHGPGDVVVAVAIQNGTQLISAIVSIVISARLVRLTRMTFDVRSALEQIRDGWHQFASNFSVSLYTQANAIVVGFSAGTAQAGLLTGSQRISQAFQQLVTPINMAVFPQVNRLTQADPPAAVRLMFRVLKAQATFAACLGLGLYFSAPHVVPLFLGEAFRPAIPVVQTLGLLPFLSGISTVLGGNMLLPLGIKGPYTASLVTAGFVNLGFLVVLAPRYGALGGAVCAVVTETFLITAMGSALYAKRAVFERMRAGESLQGSSGPDITEKG
jgi:O-antigen/teichoic acid export membrane protein